MLTVSVSAQKHIENYDPEALFNEGVLCFQNQEYGAALSAFEQYRAQVTDAKSQLKITNQQIKEIALNLGFDNVAFFNRFFKAHVGVTPKAYRNG